MTSTTRKTRTAWAVLFSLLMAGCGNGNDVTERTALDTARNDTREGVSPERSQVRPAPASDGGVGLPVGESALVERLKTGRIGVIQGSAHDTYAQKSLPDAKVSQFVSISDMVLAVDAGRVDAGIGDEAALRVLIKEKPHLAIVGDSLMDASVGAGFRKDDRQLREQFNRFLVTIRKDGTWQGMVDRWIRDGSEDMPSLTFKPGAPPLKVGNAILGLPSVAVKDNRLIGFEVELAERFAAFIGRRPAWQTVDWAALIPSLASGKTDVIVSSMFITEERRQRIDFSDPYYLSGSHFFVSRTAQASMGGTEPAGAAPPGFWKQLGESFHSNIVAEDRYLLLLEGLWVTVKLSVLSAVFGSLLGASICYMRMSSHRILSMPARLYISVLRGTPVLVLLMLIFYVLFASVEIDPVLAAVFAFGLNFAAYAAEIFRSGVQSIDRGQTEAGIAMGFTRLSTFRYVVLPQTVQRILPVYKGEFISMVKMTSIVGYVAVQDLAKASDIIRSRTFDAFFPLVMVALLYFLISWALIQFLEYLEARTDPIRRRQAGAAP